MRNRRTTLTPTGVARILGRGVLANFAPGNQAAEIERFIELFRDMAMCRAADGETSQDRLAAGDTDWLVAIAEGLESFLSG